VFEGSPVSKAIEILRGCSDAEVATVMESFAKAKPAAEDYENYHEAALKIWRHGRGRPGYDEENLLDEMEWLLKNGNARSIARAAVDVAATILDPEQRRNAPKRLAEKYRERLCPDNHD
jgi:hypothetical protein